MIIIKTLYKKQTTVDDFDGDAQWPPAGKHDKVYTKDKCVREG